MKVFGVTGWKNAGKTGLMERLVSEISARGFSVSTLKHAHHDFDVDQPGRDSYRHRDAGAQQALLSSGKRWALMTELRDTPEPSLNDLLIQMQPVDLILIEGWKREPHPKIEAWRADAKNPLIAPDDSTIVAVASDTVLDVDRPQFDLDDTAAIADFVLQQVGLPRVFDRVIAVDWSASASRSSAVPKADAIYMCDMDCDGPVATYHRTRADVFARISRVLDKAVAQGQKTLIGFDFAFGYPVGFAQAVTGSSEAPALWSWMDQQITDADNNANNRFEVAAQINELFDGVGPFWGCPPNVNLDALPHKGTDRTFKGIAEKRLVEATVPSAQSVWKLFTTGSVGSQVLMGLPYLHKLRERYGTDIQFWPFDAASNAIITCVEIYPSLYSLPDYQDGDADIYRIKDARQVREVCRQMRNDDGSNMPKNLPDTTREEGWIYGVPAP